MIMTRRRSLFVMAMMIYIYYDEVCVCLSRKIITSFTGLQITMVFGWFPWFFKVVSWFLVGFHGFSRWFHGFSWFLVGFHGFSRFPGGFSLSLMVPGWLNPS